MNAFLKMKRMSNDWSIDSQIDGNEWDEFTRIMHNNPQSSKKIILIPPNSFPPTKQSVNALTGL